MLSAALFVTLSSSVGAVPAFYYEKFKMAITRSVFIEYSQSFITFQNFIVHTRTKKIKNSINSIVDAN